MRKISILISVLCWGVLSMSMLIVANPPGVGEIIRSSDTLLNGVPVPDSGTVTPGSVLATGDHGSALVQFSPDTQVNLLGRTSVTFKSDAGHLWAQMSAGTLGAKSLGAQRLLVETSDYEIGPAQEGAIYVVAMMPDLTTIVSARRGSVSILQKSSGGKYVLAEGHYARIADGPQGVPPQQASQNGPGGPPPGLLNSTGKLFIIAVGSGAGIAVILDQTVLAGPSVSPSVP
jgi:hypothetical protein